MHVCMVVNPIMADNFVILFNFLSVYLSLRKASWLWSFLGDFINIFIPLFVIY